VRFYLVFASSFTLYLAFSEVPRQRVLSSGSCLAAVEKAVAETDVGAVLPLGRQHSLLNIINVVIQKLGHLIHIYLPKVLQILLCVTASVSVVLEKRDQVTRILSISKDSVMIYLYGMNYLDNLRVSQD